jgi:hypothetical protein
MKHMHHAFPENSLISTCIMLAHSTFYDALPANAERREPIAPAGVAPSKRAPREPLMQRLVNALDNWFYRQRVREREAYLSQAKDIFELEYRMRQLERH